MAEDAKTPEEDVKFPLNERLLEESTRIKEERKTIKERIKKIEESKSNVTDSVYEKVKSDYQAQLNTNTDQLLEKKQDIDRELATLYEAKKKLEVNVSEHRQKLEEITFRNDLGEYKGENFHKLADEQNEKLGKFEKILAAIDSNIGEYESLFEGEDNLAESAEEVKEAPPIPPPPGMEKTGETPASEDEYQVGEGEGYFSAVTDEVPIVPDAISEKTSKEITPIEPADDEEQPKSATVSIIEGFGKGDVFEVTDEEITIGRASSNGIVLKEAKVSRQHASIKKQGEAYLITDFHSSNGVYVNDEKIVEHALSNGDIIKIGDFVLKFTC